MEDKTKKIEMQISGMHCATCALTVEKGLAATPGVRSSSVNLVTGKAQVEYDPDQANLAELTGSVEKTGFSVSPERVIVKIGGMACVSCVQTVTRALQNLEGVISADVNLSTEKAYIGYNPSLTSVHDIRDAITGVGFRFLGTDQDPEKNTGDAEDLELRRQLLKILVGFLGSAVLMGLMFVPFHDMNLIPYIQFLITTPLLIWLGNPIFRAAFGALRNKILNMDVMYAMGIGVAYVASLLGTFSLVLNNDALFYETTLMLTSFLMLGRYLEARAKGKTTSAIKSLIKLQSESATVLKDGTAIPVPVEDLRIGDIIQVKPGDRIPVDGMVVSGSSYVDESMVTGEPLAVLRSPGDEVIGGTLATTGAFQYKATRVGAETMLARIIRLVEEAQGSRPPVQHLADYVVSWFIPVVLIIALSSCAYWYVVRGMDLRFSLGILISVLVVACPCALGLATPTAITVGIGRGAEFGILIRNGTVLQVADRITLALFDKTGTITSGKPVVTDLDSFTDNPSLLLSLAVSLEHLSEHPIGRAITDAAEKQGIEPAEVTGFETASGMGISGVIAGGRILLGNSDFIRSSGAELTQKQQDITVAREAEGKTTVLLSRESQVLGVISISDTMKPGSDLCVKLLADMGIHSAMVTGDNQVTADAVAGRVGITKVFARVLPEGKEQEVSKLQTSGEVVVFIGDGINDAPALAKADTGIAIGSGTDVAIESADIVLVRDELTNVAASIQLARKVMGRIRLNLFWAFAYNMLLLPLAAGVLYPVVVFRPEYGAFAMALSSVTVVSLSLLLKRYTPPAVRAGKNDLSRG